MKKISVIIPTYRPLDYLWKCLRSLIKQTLLKDMYEVIIVINGDKEPYYSNILEFIKVNQCSNFQLLYSIEKGVSCARNKGLDYATGEYITFVDDDDYVSESFLEQLLINADQNTISLSNYIAFLDSSEEHVPHSLSRCFLENYKKKNLTYNKVRKYFSGSCAKLIHKDIINNRRFDPSFRIGEDSLFLFLISDKYKNVSFTEKDAIYFRRYRGGSSIFSMGVMTRCKSSFLLCYRYISIFISNPKYYNLIFLLTRILGALRSALSRPDINNINLEK